MLTLRLTRRAHEVEASLMDGDQVEAAVNPFSFALSHQDQEQIRWYLEEYLEFPLDPAPTLAARALDRMIELGAELFGLVFASDAAPLWEQMRGRLAEARVEVTGDLPWELLRDPDSDAVLALHARSFVRVGQGSVAVSSPPLEGQTLRVLAVIARPHGAGDVPFRSVASHLLRLGAAVEGLQVDVLRPPTFERLAEALAAAHAGGHPYHVVHFDGHGGYTGGRGYLLFERGEKEAEVDGARLGQVLADTGVPVLVLNACRSAHAEAPAAPAEDVESVAAAHAGIRAYGSLAEEVVEAGVAGVVAMRYNVYVVTAAAFVAELYGALLDGDELGRAVTRARQRLAADPQRAIAFDPLPLQDWPVPVVYESNPLALFAPSGRRHGHVVLDEEAGAAERAALEGVPSAPGVGFFGRDETLLALDRSFDSAPAVLLTGMAGAGKTSAASEFARWYLRTRGADAVLWSSFTRLLTVPQLLDQLAAAFREDLAADGIDWLTLPEQRRRTEALRLLHERRLLWVWDNVEPVAGFPTGTPSAWSAGEQDELRAFLGDVGETDAKVLLTSRRDERRWVGDLVARVQIPAMPMRERVLLAMAVASRQGRALSAVEDWRPLLRYSEGNPFTVTLVVSQALRQGLHSAREVEAFVEQLRAGQALTDDETLGRTASLGASLRYGFEQAFDEHERRHVALLHLFQGFVNVDALVFMGRMLERRVQGITALDRRQWIGICDRADEVGLVSAAGGGFYRLHPALGWFLAPVLAGTSGSVDRTTRAYARTMSMLGEAYLRLYEQDGAGVVALLQSEEANLLHARRLALAGDWWEETLGTMQGLLNLYVHTGRTAEWTRLVEEVAPLFIDPVSGKARVGREAGWGVVTKYKARLAQWKRDSVEAERLLRDRIDDDERRAVHALGAPARSLTEAERHDLRALSVAKNEMGESLRQRKSPDCVSYYREAITLAVRAEDRTGEAFTIYNLAAAFVEIREVRNLDEAERLYLRCLSLVDDTQALFTARIIGQLGMIGLARHDDEVGRGSPDCDPERYLDEARQQYEWALSKIPADARRSRAEAHGQLGIVYAKMGAPDEALAHFQHAISHDVAIDDRFGAGLGRSNAAILLLQAQRLDDALDYARSALSDFQSLGGRAAQNVEETSALVATLEQLVALERGE